MGEQSACCLVWRWGHKGVGSCCHPHHLMKRRKSCLVAVGDSGGINCLLHMILCQGHGVSVKDSKLVHAGALPAIMRGAHSGKNSTHRWLEHGKLKMNGHNQASVVLDQQL